MLPGLSSGPVRLNSFLSSNLLLWTVCKTFCCFLIQFSAKLAECGQLEVRNCISMKTFLDFEGMKPKHVPSTLSCLERLESTDLSFWRMCGSHLKTFWHFKNLRILQVMRCMILRYAFPCFIVEGLAKLESMYISNCPGWEGMVAKYESQQ